MTDEITEEDKRMVAGIMGDKMKEQMEIALDKVKDKEKTADVRYELTQQKLDQIIDLLKELRK